MKNALSAMANAFASCIENSSACGTLFSTATSTTSTFAGTVLESGYNALTNSASISTAVYNLAYPLSTSTGFILPSSSVPGGFTFNNALAATSRTSATQNQPTTIAIDASGNAWITNQNSSSITELSPSGALLGNFTVGNVPFGIAIDANGNIWNTNYNDGTVTELNPSGTVIATFTDPGGTGSSGIAFDASGNLWVTNFSNGKLSRLSSSGTWLGPLTAAYGTIRVAIDSTGNVYAVNNGNGAGNTISKFNSAGTLLSTFTIGTAPNMPAIDPSGNIWVSIPGTNSLQVLNSSGTLLQTYTFSALGLPLGITFDQSGNAWTGWTTNVLVELSPTGTVLASYTKPAGGNGSIAIDTSGNVWDLNRPNGNGSPGSATEFLGVANGPNFFPFSGPVFSSH